jgi:hypothetical protein
MKIYHQGGVKGDHRGDAEQSRWLRRELPPAGGGLVAELPDKQ